MSDFPEKEYEQIDRYIQGQLSEDDRLAFERRLLNEPALAIEVDWLRKFYVNYEHVRLEDTLREVHTSLQQRGELEPLVRPLWGGLGLGRLVAVAASVAVLVSAGFWFWQYQRTLDSPSVAVKPSSPTPPLADTDTALRPGKVLGKDVPGIEQNPSLPTLARNYANQSPKGTGSVPAALNEAVTNFEKGQLDRAIAQLRQPIAPATKPAGPREFGATPNDTAGTKPTPAAETSQIEAYRLFYLGLSYLRNGKPRQALAELERVNRFPLTRTAQWYRVLSHLQLNQTNQAMQLLNQIRQTSGHPYQMEATNLANRLSAQNQP